MMKGAFLITVVAGFCACTEAFQCYNCTGATTDGSCNANVENCTLVIQKCVSVFTSGVVNKHCAGSDECPGNSTSGITCCNSTLCNAVTPGMTVNTPEPPVDLLTDSVGSNPSIFLSSVILYQALTAVIYLGTTLYIFYNTPRPRKSHFRKVAPDEEEEIVELE